MIKLAWALPTLISVGLVGASAQADFTMPAPFLIIFVSVVLAGSFGGQRTGFVAGLIAALFVVKSYFDQFGPATLTGGVLQVVIGSVLFFLIGTLLGRLRDQRDASMLALRNHEQNLEILLQKEFAERSRQEAIVAEREAQLVTATRIAGLGHFSFEAFTGNCNYCSEQHAANLGMTPQQFIEIAKGNGPQLPHVHPDDRAIVMAAIEKLNSGESQTFEYRLLDAKGEVRYIRQIEVPRSDETGKVVEHIGTSMDMTDLRQAEARVRQSQRIEVIGTLTGGVAHDFNNLLAVILGNLELCLELDREEDRRELIQAAIKATVRGAGLTHNLLSFARRAHLEPKRINLNQTIQDTMTWGSRVLPKTIALENSLMAGLWDVELDATSAENAIINILLNARDAMPDGGRVTIETANMRIGEEYVTEREEDIEPGRYVMLAISDTGHGIAADKLDSIFEPFYTDKPVGEGSGLGLSMVQGFIKQSGGAIRVYSEVGVGTTFKLYFKAAEKHEHEARAEPQKTLQPPSGKTSVLVAEDEMDVMRILKRTLEDAGYDVTTAMTGDEALEIYQSLGPFDLLITDVVMPGATLGPALAKAVRVMDPDLPCIFLSGYAAEATVHGNGLKPSDVRLMKPIGRADLLHAVSNALRDAKPNR
ncbi:PAS domain-containing hybrid sensor histidine kinase/response regulator [Antarctobacter sp.]|uniref:PAS domain-containing hybrid sensor histidine kinase/response regulator n=1 Tax=Antarctobacter sp. TaxID=1872577 RepID=UPI002B2713BC|nr:ATP-binding protein [Antarctobacter sp.]